MTGRSILRDWFGGGNVRPSGTTDPRACGYNPRRGSVVDGAHGRALAPGRLCGVCRFGPEFGTHCYLYEVCDHCGDEENPCAVARKLAEYPRALP